MSNGVTEINSNVELEVQNLHQLDNYTLARPTRLKKRARATTKSDIESYSEVQMSSSQEEFCTVTKSNRKRKGVHFYIIYTFKHKLSVQLCKN